MTEIEAADKLKASPEAGGLELSADVPALVRAMGVKPWGVTLAAFDGLVLAVPRRLSSCLAVAGLLGVPLLLLWMGALTGLVSPGTQAALGLFGFLFIPPFLLPLLAGWLLVSALRDAWARAAGLPPGRLMPPVALISAAAIGAVVITAVLLVHMLTFGASAWAVVAGTWFWLYGVAEQVFTRKPPGTAFGHGLLRGIRNMGAATVGPAEGLAPALRTLAASVVLASTLSAPLLLFFLPGFFGSLGHIWVSSGTTVLVLVTLWFLAEIAASLFAYSWLELEGIPSPSGELPDPHRAIESSGGE